MRQSRRATLSDFVLIIAIAGVLTGLHFLIPVNIQEQLAFNHEQFAPWSLLTAAYFHASDTHLYGNLIGYFIGASVAYSLCDTQGQRRWFWTTTVTFLFVLPILVNLTSYAAFQSMGIETNSRGFSGVVAAYGGFILVALSRFIADQYNVMTGAFVGEAIFLVLLAELVVIYVGQPSLLVVGLLVIGLGMTLGQIGKRGIQNEWTENELQKIAIDTGFTVGVVVLLAAFVWVLFPATLIQSGNFTNIIGHGAGFLWGGLISTLVLTLQLSGKITYSTN